MLAIGEDWRRNFRRIYRLNPEVVLKKAVLDIRLESHFIRPFTDTELHRICIELGLDPSGFRDETLRRAGVLALSARTAEEQANLSVPQLREVLARRWVEAGSDTAGSGARQALWSLLGRLTLQGDSFALDLQGLYSRFEGQHSTEILRAQASGPLRWEAERMEPESPAWADVAAAEVLHAAIERHGAEPIRSPVRSSIIDTLVEMIDGQRLAAQVERRLRSIAGKDATSTGYLGPVLGTLHVRLTSEPQIVLENLPLQGPDVAQLKVIEAEVVAIVREALLKALRQAADRLVASLAEVLPTSVSGYRGGYECWRTAREWSNSLPLRASAENAVASHLPGDGSWRYEDILDVAVTGATTEFMKDLGDRLTTLLADRRCPAEEYLADIWDGINDGGWDQIDASSTEFIYSFALPHNISKIVNAHHCRMQRAHLGAQDVSGWRIEDCDILLADFRSCTNVEAVSFAGSNWWSAILPPPARYKLSKTCHVLEFLSWCQTPPWQNPYYSRPWPTPFDE